MTEVEIKESNVAPAAASPASPAPAAASAPEPSGVEAESFGRTLAAARQARGLSQGEVAAQLRLHLRQVRAIEAEDLSALPEGPFVRGFVRNYAKLVNVPPEPLLALLRERLQPTEPLRAEAGGAAVSPVQMAAREQVSRVAVVGGAIGTLVVFALLGWWTMHPGGSAPESVAQAPVATTARGERTAAAPVESADQPPAAGEVAAPAATSEQIRDTAVASAGGESLMSSTALHFNFRDRSWVQVTQADGTVLMSRNNSAGAQETLEGTPPYTLVIGNASKVDLEFRGKPIDLGAVTSRGDVARLRLE